MRQVENDKDFSFLTASFQSTAQQVRNTLSQEGQTCLSQLWQSSELKGGLVSIVATPLLFSKVYYSALRKKRGLLEALESAENE